MPTNFVPVHPISGVAVNPDGSIAVPALLQQPNRINTALLQWLDRLEAATPDLVPVFYSTGGGVSGGAIIYTTFMPGAPGTIPERDVERIEPAAEYPLVRTMYGIEDVATVEKYGGKFFVTDEARDRNDQAGFRGLARTLALEIKQKLNAIAIKDVDDALIAAGQVVSTPFDWSTYNPVTDPPAQSPMGDLLEIQANAAAEGTPAAYDTVVLNPLDAFLFVGSWYGVSQPPGVPTVYSTAEVDAGTGYYIERAALGSMLLEQALRTVTWREEATDRTWVQSGVRPLFYIDNPSAGVKFSIAQS